MEVIDIICTIYFWGNYSNGTNSEINYKNGTNSEINYKNGTNPTPLSTLHAGNWYYFCNLFAKWYPYLSNFPFILFYERYIYH
jgi:hypothetical protein